MKLEQGPIPLISADVSAPALSGPSFADLVAAQSPGLDVLEGSMDALLASDAIIDELPIDDGLGPVLDSLGSDVAQLGAFDFDGASSGIDLKQQSSSLDMISAYNSVPAEAWRPVPGPQDFGNNAGLPDGSNAIAAQLNNLTRPGDATFFPGDQYEVVFQVSSQWTGAGSVPLDISLSVGFNSGQFSQTIDLGTTGEASAVRCSGYFTSDDVGDFRATAFSFTAEGVELLAPALLWSVSPLPAGTADPTPAAAQNLGPGLHLNCTLGGQPLTLPPFIGFSNDSGGNQTAFYTGDAWTLTVEGPPDSEVKIWAVFNGQNLPVVTIGQTDDTGEFVLQGAFNSPDYVGAWHEFYEVGNVVAGNSLTFTVSADARPGA